MPLRTAVLDPEQPPVFKSDGTQIRNPIRFIQKIANYEGGLFTQNGTPIEDPHAYIASWTARKNGGGHQGSGGSLAPAVTLRPAAPGPFAPVMSAADRESCIMFKTDGTPIKNPVRFVSNIRQYEGGLMTA